MKSDKVNQERLDFVMKAKSAYRRIAHAMSWEEKIASIERMWKTSKIAKAGNVCEPLNMALPCRISVYTEQGKTKIGMIKPIPMLAALSQDATLVKVAQEVEATTRKMIDESR